MISPRRLGQFSNNSASSVRRSVSSGCARFSRKAVTRRLTAALLPAACLLAFFGFVGILYFLPACLIIITRQHTHTPLKKKAGAHPQNLPKKRETTPLKTDVFLPLFSAHTHTHGHTHRKLKVTGLNYCIKIYIQVSNNKSCAGDET